MTRRALLMSAVTGLAVTACSRAPDRAPDRAPSEVPATSKPERKLLWSEEFEELDLASPANPRGRWRPNDVWQPLDEGYADFATGQHSTWLVNPAQQIPGASSPFTLDDSVLTITCSRTPPEVLAQVNGCPWLGGLLVSNTALPSMTFGYGYYEFRARLPTPGRGMFPALWFYGARDQNPEDKSAAEIDVFEIFGEAKGRPWHSTLHGDEQVDIQVQNRDTSGWHTYGLDWTAEHMRFYYDGKLTASAPEDKVGFFNGVKMSIRLDLVMDALHFTPDHRSDSSTPDALHLDIDYIRQYDRFAT